MGGEDDVTDPGGMDMLDVVQVHVYPASKSVESDDMTNAAIGVQLDLADCRKVGFTMEAELAAGLAMLLREKIEESFDMSDKVDDDAPQ